MALSRVSSVALLAAAFALGAGCTTSAPIPESSASNRTMVSRIEISQSVGQVGREFSAALDLHTRRYGDSEVQVRSLPPGLRFSPEELRIHGVPEADGFYSVIVRVRKKQGKGIHFVTPEGAWYSERINIDIYKAIDDQKTASSSDADGDLALGDR